MEANTKETILVKYDDHGWEFIFPDSFDHNEMVHEEFWDAVEVLDNDPEFAEVVFKSLIKRFPGFIDAYNHLSIAFEKQNKRFESHLVAEKAYLMGKSLFPKTFNPKKDNLIWSCLGNRPFLRSCQIYGLECQDRGEFEKAMGLYQEVLQINKADNQGVRILYLECLFELMDLMAISRFIRKYNDDWSIEFLYGQVALEILLGNPLKAKIHLAKAIKCNPHFPAEVVKTKHKAPAAYRIPGEPFFDAGIPVGSGQEAYAYWERNKKLYKNRTIIDFFKQVV